MKISWLFGKRVESAFDRSGYIIRVNCVGLDITSFTCADDDEQEFDIPVQNVTSIKNTVTYTHSGKRDNAEKSLRLGRPVFDSEGLFLGKLTDLTAEKYTIAWAHVGNKKFSADDLIYGDGIIIKNTVRFLKSDVKKSGKIIFRKGTPLTGEIAQKAQLAGEYVQTNLKSIN